MVNMDQPGQYITGCITLIMRNLNAVVSQSKIGDSVND
jgi:hypothetical protein